MSNSPNNAAIGAFIIGALIIIIAAVLFVSGYDAGRLDGVERRLSAILPKPFSPDELIEQVRVLLGRV